MKKVKVCGLTRDQDVTQAVELGADMVGFVVAPSPRSVDLGRLGALVSLVPATVLTVAVAVNPTRDFVDSLLALVDRVQFHGDETPEFCSRYGRRAIKAFRIKSPSDLSTVFPYESSVGALLLDSYRRGQAGGTGRTFDWSYLRDTSFSLPVFLAGGLNPHNVKEAVKVEAVSGLDVSSGLEARPGVKDPVLMREFFLNRV